MIINAHGLKYKELNKIVRDHVAAGDEKRFTLDGVNGQRYIGAGLIGHDIVIDVNGVPGDDLGAFMDGPAITVNANAQNAVGNTMNGGTIIIKGLAGDVLGYGMRGGRLLIQRDVGYRVGIHMKSYKDKIPVIVIGGKAGDFLGEYMAGGILIVLGINSTHDREIVGNFVGPGMHGGMIFINGHVPEAKLARDVKVEKPTPADLSTIATHIEEYRTIFSSAKTTIDRTNFIKIVPKSSRPYGNIYAYS